MDFETDLFLESLPALLGGAWLTVQLTVVSVSLGLMIGVLGGLARVSDHKFLNIPALVYVTIMRGVPMLVTILFLYYGMPSIGFVWGTPSLWP